LNNDSFVSETVAVSGMRGKREEREIEERERSGERKFNKLVERGAAFQPAPAPLTCSGCDLQKLCSQTLANLASLAVKLASCNQADGTIKGLRLPRITRHNCYKCSYICDNAR
jgi:hypothetical protein